MEKAFRLILLSICVFFFASFYKADKEVVRKTISLNGSWNFSVDSLSLGESNNWETIGLPKNTSRIVSVPHVWNVEKGLEKYWGDCWYEREFEFSESDLQKTVRIQFDAVYHDATIYINGKKAGEHYNRFFVDISSFIKIGDELDRISAEYNNKPMTISEWGLCEPAHKGGDSRRIKEMVEQLKIYGSKPYIAGAIYFCLNDYRTHMGEGFTYSYPQRVHGVVDINLKPKPSYETLKTVSSPVEFVSFTKKNNKVHITLKGNPGLPSYTVRNYYIMSDKTKTKIPELRPGEEKTFEIPATKEIQIYRPTEFEVLHIKLN